MANSIIKVPPTLGVTEGDGLAVVEGVDVEVATWVVVEVVVVEVVVVEVWVVLEVAVVPLLQLARMNDNASRMITGIIHLFI